ncbi:MAG: hypothetical protein ACYCWB_08470 [Thiobacillus sp.]
MHTLRIPFPVPLWCEFLTELRIDVRHQSSDIEKQLQALYRRLNTPGDALYDLPLLCIRIPGLVLRYREADGEHYVYIEDPARRCLAGYVVFNRLVEVNRRADSHLRAPHAKLAPAYQRRGIATTIYRWWLGRGNTLITGARQSAGAHALWLSLGKHYELLYVELRANQLRCLGLQVDSRVRQDLHTRIVMLGRGWDVDRLAQATRMQV